MLSNSKGNAIFLEFFSISNKVLNQSVYNKSMFNTCNTYQSDCNIFFALYIDRLGDRFLCNML
jgi:hypothetical protein